MPVEVIEEEEEDWILSDGHNKPSHWVSGLQEVEEHSVSATDDKLSDLNESDVLLPPEVLLDFRPEAGQTVVGVHDHVDQSVADPE